MCFTENQQKECEGDLADLYTTCEFVDKALASGTSTQVLLVKKQVIIIASTIISLSIQINSPGW